MKQTEKKYGWLFLMNLFLILSFPVLTWAGTPAKKDVGRQSEKNVEKAIQIQQKTQEDRTKWEQKKSALAVQYEALLLEKQMLEKENGVLAARQQQQVSLNRILDLQKKESIRVANELMPFLDTVYERIQTLVANDPPFLKEEREQRLVTLSGVMKDPEVTISEKYRKVMEALFIEAEYGATIEVYQDKIQLDSTEGAETLANIFRLGRVCLFFLSLDQNTCGVFNPGEKVWQVLPETLLPSIRSAVEIGSKRRPVELLTLPIGRLVKQEGSL